MDGPTRDGTAKLVSRDQDLRRVRERGKEEKWKRRRRGRAGRRAKRREADSERGKVCRLELTIATHNVRTMAVDGKHGVGRAAEVLIENTRSEAVTSSDCKKPGVAASLPG